MFSIPGDNISIIGQTPPITYSAFMLFILHMTRPTATTSAGQIKISSFASQSGFCSSCSLLSLICSSSWLTYYDCNDHLLHQCGNEDETPATPQHLALQGDGPKTLDPVTGLLAQMSWPRWGMAFSLTSNRGPTAAPGLCSIFLRAGNKYMCFSSLSCWPSMPQPCSQPPSTTTAFPHSVGGGYNCVLFSPCRPRSEAAGCACRMISRRTSAAVDPGQHQPWSLPPDPDR